MGADDIFLAWKPAMQLGYNEDKEELWGIIRKVWTFLSINGTNNVKTKQNGVIRRSLWLTLL